MLKHVSKLFHFIYPFTCWWTFGWWPPLGCREQGCCDMGVENLFESRLSVPLAAHLWIELMGHMVILCLTFWGALEPFFRTAVPFYIPPAMNGRFQCSSSLILVPPLPPAIFDNSHPNGCKVSRYNFYVIFMVISFLLYHCFVFYLFFLWLW